MACTVFVLVHAHTYNDATYQVSKTDAGMHYHIWQPPCRRIVLVLLTWQLQKVLIHARVGLTHPMYCVTAQRQSPTCVRQLDMSNCLGTIRHYQACTSSSVPITSCELACCRSHSFYGVILVWCA